MDMIRCAMRIIHKRILVRIIDPPTFATDGGRLMRTMTMMMMMLCESIFRIISSELLCLSLWSHCGLSRLLLRLLLLQLLLLQVYYYYTNVSVNRCTWNHTSTGSSTVRTVDCYNGSKVRKNDI